MDLPSEFIYFLFYLSLVKFFHSGPGAAGASRFLALQNDLSMIKQQIMRFGQLPHDLRFDGCSELLQRVVIQSNYNGQNVFSGLNFLKSECQKSEKFIKNRDQYLKNLMIRFSMIFAVTLSGRWLVFSFVLSGGSVSYAYLDQVLLLLSVFLAIFLLKIVSVLSPSPALLDVVDSDQSNFWFDVLFKVESVPASIFFQGEANLKTNQLLKQKLWNEICAREKREGVSLSAERKLFVEDLSQDLAARDLNELSQMENWMPVFELFGGIIIVFFILFVPLLNAFMS